MEAGQYTGSEPSVVVTIHPDVPMRHDADSRKSMDLGTFPTLTLAELTGDRAMELFQAMAVGSEAAEDLWPKVARSVEYYLADNRELLMSTLRDIWGRESELPSETAHERASLTNGAMVVVWRQIVGPETQGDPFIRSYWEKDRAAFTECPKYIEMAQTLESDGTLSGIQRLVIDQLNTFIRTFESWRMGILPRLLDEAAKQKVDGLRVFRDEFSTLRDLYLQGFEVVCKTLRFAMAAHNTVERGDPDDFGPQAPPGVSDQKRNPPPNLKGYDRLANADKLCYVRNVPEWSEWADYLNSTIRNTVGHATARHELTTGRIVADRLPEDITYLNLMAAVFDVFDALAAGAQLVHRQRVLGSPDFARVEESKEARQR